MINRRVVLFVVCVYILRSIRSADCVELPVFFVSTSFNVWCITCYPKWEEALDNMCDVLKDVVSRDIVQPLASVQRPEQKYWLPHPVPLFTAVSMIPNMCHWSGIRAWHNMRHFSRTILSCLFFTRSSRFLHISASSFRPVLDYVCVWNECWYVVCSRQLLDVAGAKGNTPRSAWTQQAVRRGEIVKFASAPTLRTRIRGINP